MTVPATTGAVAGAAAPASTAAAATTATNAQVSDEHHTDDGEHDDDDQQQHQHHPHEQPSLIIPITSSTSTTNGGGDAHASNYVEIFPEEIATISVQQLIQVLRDEDAESQLWAYAACLYMQQKHSRESLTILEEACDLPAIDKNQRVRVLAATGIAHLAAIQQANAANAGSGGAVGAAAAGAGGGGATTKKTETHELADQKFTQAGKIDTFFPMTWIGRGILDLSLNRLEQAKFFFQTTAEQCGPVIPALLGMAAVLYRAGDYHGAQSKYEEVIRRYPASSGAAARVGYGLACYQCGQIDRSKAAFQRALAIDPQCVEAMVGIAILDMAGFDAIDEQHGTSGKSATAKKTEKAIKLMSEANLLDHSNAMVQNHLANHYFWKWTPVVGTVTMQHNSTTMRATQPNMPLEPGERIRIGTRFETTIVEIVEDGDDEDDENNPQHNTVFRIADTWKDPSANQQQQQQQKWKVWKKDYDRVIALAKGAYNSTAQQQIQAESLFFLARVYHVRADEIENAYKFYDRAVKLAPDLTPARFGLAQTCIVLQQYEKAREQLKKVLQASAHATDALALLGILEVRYAITTSSSSSSGSSSSAATNTKSRQHLEDGLMYLRKAVESDPLNPDLLVLEALALQQHETNYPKSLDKYKKAIDLMQRKNISNKGKKNAEMAATVVPYELYVNCGVLCHETKAYDEAYRLYECAFQSLDDEAGTARKGLLATDQNKKEKDAESKGPADSKGRIRHSDNHMFFEYVDTKILVQSMDDEKTDAADKDGAAADSDEMKKKRRVKVVMTTPTELRPDDLPVSVGDDVRIGNDFMTEIVDIDTSTTPGVIVIELKDPYDPMDTASEANDDDDDGQQQGKALYVKCENTLLQIPEAITVAFNIARLHESTGRILAAIELHKAIVSKVNPSYVNSYLRLACIAVDCGSLKECAAWLKLAAQTAPGNPEVLTLIGNLHLSLQDWSPAQNVFDGLMGKKLASVEAYSALSLGNIYFANLHVSASRYSKHLQYASDYYKRILQKDPANAYAANGLGAVLAERGEIFKAKEVFNRVREVSDDNIADSLLNLGHIYLAQKKHPEALQMYTSYMKRSQGTATTAADPSNPTATIITSKSRIDDIVDIYNFIAFAWFDWARHTELFNDINAAPADERYQQAMQHLQMAIDQHSSKREVLLKYNLCMTKLQAANCVLQKLTRNITRTVQEVEQALRGLEESYVVVEEILKAKSDPEQQRKINIPTATLQDFMKHCKANIASAQSHLEDEKKRSVEIEQEREIRRLAAQATLKEQELKKAIANEESLKRQEERDIKADAKMQQVQQLQANWNEEQERAAAEKEKRASKKSGGGKSAIQADEIGLEVDDDDEDNTDGDGRRHRGLFDDSDDESVASNKNEQQQPEQQKGSSREAMIASQKALFGDSDDEDENTAKAKPPTQGQLFADSDDDNEDEAGNNKAASNVAESQQQATAPSQKDLFGDSDEESDEDLLASKKRGTVEGSANEGQPRKKQRILEDDESD